MPPPNTASLMALALALGELHLAREHWRQHVETLPATATDTELLMGSRTAFGLLLLDYRPVLQQIRTLSPELTSVATYNIVPGGPAAVQNISRSVDTALRLVEACAKSNDAFTPSTIDAVLNAVADVSLTSRNFVLQVHSHYIPFRHN